MTFKLDRRGLLKTGAAAGILATAGLPLRSEAAPQRGGTLRVGLSGANTSDSWDGRTQSDAYMQFMGQGCVFDCLTEIGADGTLKGELAESWEASPDAKVWTFNLRKGVTFHNGKDFGADDVLETLAIHVEEGSKSPAKPIIAAIKEMKKLGSHQVQLILERGNADLPYLLSDYHILIHPAGMIEESIAKGIGTGPYRNEGFEPGVRTITSRYENYYKDDAGWFDSVEAIAINDGSARMNALMTNQVDAIVRIDFKTEALMRRNPNVKIFEVTGNQHFTFPMHTNTAPYDDNNVRLAIKHAVKRQEMVDKILQGHGAVANDHPIGPANRYYAADLPQREYDPDKAKFYLKKAGLSSLDINLSASDAAFVGAVDAAQLYQASAAAAGININVVREPADGYWSNVWLKKPFCACFWSGRATEDWMFSTAYEKGVPWNDTYWDNERFNKLLYEARAELDSNKRREIYHEMQLIVRDEGGVVVPMYANWVDAASARLAHGPDIGNVWPMDNMRMAKRWWFA
ncbi:MAG: ABC transporter substrate-binding protein [Alphaproteobacteria bacterium]|nr:MAG: ABC transporter substrate-binding protein [Alphaproteobacteria bacterium]